MNTSTPLDHVDSGARHTQHVTSDFSAPLVTDGLRIRHFKARGRLNRDPTGNLDLCHRPGVASSILRQERELRAPPVWPVLGHRSPAGRRTRFASCSNKAGINHGKLHSSQPNDGSHELYPMRSNNCVSAPLTLLGSESCADLFSSAGRNLFFQPLLNQYITGVTGRAARAKPSLIRAGPEYEQNVSRPGRKVV